MLSPPRALVLGAALSVVSLSTFDAVDARAQDGGAAARADSAVSLAIVGPDDPALRDSLRELLARLSLGIVAPGSAGSVSSRSLVADVQIDLSSPADALLLVTDAATGEVRLRRSVPRDATAAIVREEIAHAVQSAVEAALLAARERAAQPAPPPPAPPPPAPIVFVPPVAPVVKEQPRPPSHSASFGLELATLAGIGPIADGSGPASRIGVSASAVSRAFLRPSLGLSFLFAVPFDTGDAELVAAHTTIFSVRALPALGLFRGSWLAVDLGAGAGFDVINVAPHSSKLPSSAVNDQTTRVDPILSSMLTAHAAVAPGVSFLLSAGVDVDLDSRQYVFAQGPTDADVLAPWRIRPMILAGLGFTALGDGFVPSGGTR